MNVGKVCTRKVVTVNTDYSILEATRVMRHNHVGSLVVVASNKGNIPVGIITDRDIVIEVLAQEVPLDSISVEDVMSRTPVIAREDDDFFTILEKMRVNGVRRIPVTDSLGVLVGILTMDDVLRVFYEELGNIISLISHEQIQEIRKHA